MIIWEDNNRVDVLISGCYESQQSRELFQSFRPPGYFFSNLDDPFVAMSYALLEMKKTFYSPKIRFVFITD